MALLSRVTQFIPSVEGFSVLSKGRYRLQILTGSQSLREGRRNAEEGEEYNGPSAPGPDGRVSHVTITNTASGLLGGL